MYYTGIDPLSGKHVFCPTDYHEKKLQRALLQYYKRENAPLVREALLKCGREDLIGNTRDCLVRPESKGHRAGDAGKKGNRSSKTDNRRREKKKNGAKKTGSNKRRQ